MQLVHVNRDLLHVPLYKKARSLSRPDSLSGIFHRLRIHRNLTCKSLALRFGVSEDYVSAIESGSKFPSLKFCLMCAQEFGANPNWVKSKYCNEATIRFSNRLRAKLCLDN